MSMHQAGHRRHYQRHHRKRHAHRTNQYSGYNNEFRRYRKTKDLTQSDYAVRAMLLGAFIGAVVGVFQAGFLGVLLYSLIGAFVFWANFSALWTVFVDGELPAG